MNLNITARNVDLPERLKTYINDKVEGLKKYFDGIIDCQTTLESEKHEYICEMTIHGSGFTVHGEEKGGDLRSAVDKTLDKVEVQIKKYKDRLKRRKQKAAQPIESPEPEWTLDVLDGGEHDGEEFTRRIIRSKRFAIKPMSLDEAVMQLDLLDQDFLVYRDSDTQRVSVLYLRRDGHFGLIEPQF